MRYLVFDILPRTQKSYSFEYVKFLYATILLASNEIPFGCLSPNRVYSLNCENDEDSLKNLLFAYEAKLDTTKCMLEQRIKDISSKQKKRLTDTEAEQIFCAKVDVPVALSSDFDKSELFVSTDGIGLSNGCPSEEEVLWESRYRKSKKTLSKLLKQSNRAVKRAAADARQEDNFYYGDVSLLNEFQLEDVCEHITNEELNMIATHPPDLYDEEPFLKEMETEDTAIKNKIRRRMYRNTTLIIAATGFLAYMVGFFTLFYRNSSSNAFNTTVSVIITLSALGLIALIAFVTLFFLKRALIKLFKRYNWVMHGIDNDVHEAMGKYSNYLSHMCNVRRGYAVLNATVESRDPDRERIILYRKHIMDIEAAKEEARDVFGVYMSEKPSCDLSGLSGYDYNFDRPCEYTYPIPYSEGNVRTIDFLQAGLRAEVPVDFIKSLTVRREELYE